MFVLLLSQLIIVVVVEIALVVGLPSLVSTYSTWRGVMSAYCKLDYAHLYISACFLVLELELVYKHSYKYHISNSYKYSMYLEHTSQ